MAGDPHKASKAITISRVEKKEGQRVAFLIVNQLFTLRPIKNPTNRKEAVLVGQPEMKEINYACIINRLFFPASSVKF